MALKASIGSIIAVVVLIMVAASVLPPAIDQISGTQFDEFSENPTVTTASPYSITQTGDTLTVNSVNTTTNEATMTISDGTNSEQVTQSVGEIAEYNVGDVLYEVELQGVSSGQATVLVTYDTGTGQNTAESLWDLVPMLVILTVVLYLVVGSGYITGRLK